MANPPGYDYLTFRAGVALVWRGDCWGCVLQPWEQHRCVAASPQIDAHHLLPKQAIKREFPWGAWRNDDGTLTPVPRHDAHNDLLPADVSLAGLLMDVRNGVLVRRWHHDRIEHAVWRPNLDELPTDAIVFARELGMLPRLERIYTP